MKSTLLGKNAVRSGSAVSQAQILMHAHDESGLQAGLWHFGVFLGRFLQQKPVSETLATLKQLIDTGGVRAFEDAFTSETGRERWQRACDALEAWSVQANPQAQHFGEAEAQDYGQLFMGTGDISAAPWGSMYVDFAGQERALQIQQWYKASGFQAYLSQELSDDHIGLELEFISTLCLQGEGSRHEACAFAQAQSAQWVAAWQQQVERYACTPLYPALALSVYALVQKAAHLY